jgi:photosystem II stability/assembly factor-like uncharacterized protein
MSFPNVRDGWVVAEPAPGRSVVLHTTDGGRSWTADTTG